MPAPPEMRKVHVRRKELQDVDEAAREAIDNLRKVPILGGAPVTADLALGSNMVAHGLRKTPTGWIVIDRDSAATVYRTAWDKTHLTLQVSAAVTVKMWVF